MTSPAPPHHPLQQPRPPPQPPPMQQRLVRKLVVEVIEARDLLPKDGAGTSSPYVMVDFDGQRQRTSTKYRDLNPVWNEALEFLVSDPNTMDYEELNVEVYNDKRMCSGNARKNHFLGRVKLYGSQFARRGDEGLVYFPLEKKSVFSWVRGEIGLRICYFDEIFEDAGEPPPPQPEIPTIPMEIPPESRREEVRVMEVPMPTEVGQDAGLPPVVEEMPPPHPHQPMVTSATHQHNHYPQPPYPHPPEREMQMPPPEAHMMPPPPEMRRFPIERERSRALRQSNGDLSPRIIAGKSNGESEKITAFDLVEPMRYLFVRIVKARGIAMNESPFVKIRWSHHFIRSEPLIYRPGDSPENPEWHQVFALAQNKTADAGGGGHGGAGGTLEISVWDAPLERFLGGVCFDLSDVPVRDPPDSPLAPQWYC